MIFSFCFISLQILTSANEFLSSLSLTNICFSEARSMGNISLLPQHVAYAYKSM